jgi:hypothetical protein
MVLVPSGCWSNIAAHDPKTYRPERRSNSVDHVLKGTGNMKIISGTVLLAAVAVAALAATASAKDYTVGGSDQWDTYIDYDKWTVSKKFMVGDTISACHSPTPMLSSLICHAFPSHLVADVWCAMIIR